MRISMSVCNTFERNPCIQVRFFIAKKNVVFSVGLVIVDYIAPGNTSGLYAPVALYVGTLR
jgi:hypothetical protein